MAIFFTNTKDCFCRRFYYGYIVKSIFLAIMLIIVGYLLYKEPIKATKIAGVAVCLAGLYLINK